MAETALINEIVLLIIENHTQTITVFWFKYVINYLMVVSILSYLGQYMAVLCVVAARVNFALTFVSQ